MIENPWFIGVVGSIIASIIIGTFMKLFNNQDYSLNIAKANSEIINLLVMSTAEGKLPNKGVIESLIKSIAKKHSVSVYDVYSVSDTYDDLMRIIYETNFIPHDKKQEISNQLYDLKVEVENKKQKGKVVRPSELFSLRRTLVYFYSFFILVMVTFIGIFKEKMGGEITIESLKNLSKSDTFFFIAALYAFIFFVGTRLMERRFNKISKKIIERKINNTTNIEQPDIT